jgi:hypothetical protein
LHPETRQEFALKGIRPDFVTEQATKDRFLDELKVWIAASSCDLIAEAFMMGDWLLRRREEALDAIYVRDMTSSHQLSKFNFKVPARIGVISKRITKFEGMARNVAAIWL